VLWAPWRLSYIEKPGVADGCFLCEGPCLEGAERRREALVLYAGEHASVVMNRFPYANAHLMVSPRRHTADFSGLDVTVAAAVTAVLQKAVAVIERVYAPQGINLGMNLGRVAGAGVDDHFHWHVVPRWEGDTNFMPLLAETKVIPQHVEESYDRLLPYFEGASR
jgi:ATP adenylyltransferase